MVELVKFMPDGNAADIVQMLRARADEIERGERQAHCILVLIEEEPNAAPTRYLWGTARSAQHVSGMCLKAAVDFLR